MQYSNWNDSKLSIADKYWILLNAFAPLSAKQLALFSKKPQNYVRSALTRLEERKRIRRIHYTVHNTNIVRWVTVRNKQLSFPQRPNIVDHTDITIHHETLVDSLIWIKKGLESYNVNEAEHSVFRFIPEWNMKSYPHLWWGDMHKRGVIPDGVLQLETFWCFLEYERNLKSPSQYISRFRKMEYRTQPTLFICSSESQVNVLKKLYKKTDCQKICFVAVSDTFGLLTGISMLIQLAKSNPSLFSLYAPADVRAAMKKQTSFLPNNDFYLDEA